jgi:cellulose biosynthesis protein BcsQ
MNDYKIFFADGDEDYLKAISEYLILVKPGYFTMSFYSNLTLLEKYLYEEKVNLLVISTEMYKEEYSKYAKIILWTSSMLESSYEGVSTVEKYISGEKLMKELINIYSENYPENYSIKNYNRSKIYTFFSPVGGAGKTTLSYLCANTAAKENKKVLYLNLEAFPSTSIFFDNDGRSFSEAVFYIKQGYKNIKSKIEGIVGCYNKVFYIFPLESYKDILSLDNKEMLKLINVLANDCDFEEIYIDMPSEYNNNFETILQISDRVIFILLQNITSKIKLKAFKKEINILNKDINLVYVINRFKKDYIFPFDEEKKVIRIPDVYPLLEPDGDKYKVRYNLSLEKAVNILLKEVSGV